MSTPRSLSFRPTRRSALQARLSRNLVRFIATGIFRLRLDFEGVERVPAGEPLIVAGAPHRNWIDAFLIVMALPPLPRVVFLGSANALTNTWWKRAILTLVGGVVPVSTTGQLNREGLEASLAILAAGNRLAIFPEGWEHLDATPTEVQLVKRGVAFLSQHSGCRVLPVGLAGTQELWRGKVLRLRVGQPLAALDPTADRVAADAYAVRLRDALRDTLPPMPSVPGNGSRPWRWLTDLLG